MRAKWTMSIAGATVLSSALALYAQFGGPQDMRPGLPPMMPWNGPHGFCAEGPVLPPIECVKEAGASEEQLRALQEALFEQRAKSIDLRAAVEKADLALERLMRASSPDEKAVAEAVDALNQARGELFKLDVAFGMKMKQSLGEDILRKLREQGPPDRMGHCGDGPDVDRPDMSSRDDGHRSPME